MKPLPKIISYFTKDTPYEWQAEGLKKSCEFHSLDYEINSVRNAGSWEMNCIYKPIYILEMLKKHQTGVLWIDCDAIIENRPKWVGAFESDIAIRVSPDCDCDHPSKVFSGTLFCNYNAKCAKIIKKWAENCLKEISNLGRKEEVWDQIILRDVIRNFSTDLQVGLLPIEYLKIDGHPIHSSQCENAFIVQHQASRMFKKWVNASS
jgi:hypothetical protein